MCYFISDTSSMAGSTEKLIWVDLEMSGLDVNKERILEMAIAVTDSTLDNMVKVSISRWCVSSEWHLTSCALKQLVVIRNV